MRSANGNRETGGNKQSSLTATGDASAAVVDAAAADMLPKTPETLMDGDKIVDRLQAIVSGNGQPVNHAGLRAEPLRPTHLRPEMQVPVVEQVVLKIRNGSIKNEKHYEIHLDPSDLGRVDVRMDVDARGHTHLTMTVDKKETLDLLQRDRVSLEKSLQELGLKADSGSMSFNLREQGRGQQFGDAQQQNDGRGSWQGDKLPEELREEAPPAQPYRGMVLSLDEGVNIRV